MAPAAFWPSVGEYLAYDDLMYLTMASDELRNAAYQRAIADACRDRVVLEIGTGAEAILARLCIDAGARHVYACEVLEDSYTSAATLIERLGLSDRITVIHAASFDLRLPEKPSVCVSEIIGSIGSAEGALPVLNDARRLLTDHPTFIPFRCITHMAVYRLPPELATHPTFARGAAHYARRAFAAVGRPFDIRVSLDAPDYDANIVSTRAVFEDLDFTRENAIDMEQPVDLTIDRPCVAHGLLLWIELYADPTSCVRATDSRLRSWNPVFVPVFYPGVSFQEGDNLRGLVRRHHSTRAPDYSIELGSKVREFRATLPYLPLTFKHDAFYKRLMAEMLIPGQNS